MRKLLIFAALLFASSAHAQALFQIQKAQSAGTPPAYVKNISAGNSGVGSIGATFSGSITANDAVPGFVYWNDATATVSGVARSAGTASGCSFSTVGSEASSGNNHAELFVGTCTGGGTLTVTVTFSSTTSGAVEIVMHDVTNCTTTSDGTVINPQTSNTGTPTSTAVTTTTSSDYIFGFTYDASGNASVIAAGSGYTLRYYVSSDPATEDQVQTSAGSIAATFAYTGGSADVTLTGVLALKP